MGRLIKKRKLSKRSVDVKGGRARTRSQGPATKKHSTRENLRVQKNPRRQKSDLGKQKVGCLGGPARKHLPERIQERVFRTLRGWMHHKLIGGQHGGVETSKKMRPPRAKNGSYQNQGKRIQKKKQWGWTKKRSLKGRIGRKGGPVTSGWGRAKRGGEARPLPQESLIRPQRKDWKNFAEAAPRKGSNSYQAPRLKTGEGTRIVYRIGAPLRQFGHIKQGESVETKSKRLLWVKPSTWSIEEKEKRIGRNNLGPWIFSSSYLINRRAS